MKTKLNKNLIDDGFNAELVENAIFTGLLEIPLVKKPTEFIIPKSMIPFSERRKSKNTRSSSASTNTTSASATF